MIALDPIYIQSITISLSKKMTKTMQKLTDNETYTSLYIFFQWFTYNMLNNDCVSTGQTMTKIM